MDNNQILLYRKIFCAMYYEFEMVPMLLKSFRTYNFPKYICKVKFHMLVGPLVPLF